MNIYVIDLLPEEFDDMLTKVGRESRVQRGKSYPGLPEELKDFYCYYTDCGHSINAIPECLLQEAIDSGELSDYEAAVPVKYVLEKGYRFLEDHIVIDVPYDEIMGVVTPYEYDEF